MSSTISQDGGTIYFRYDSLTIQYSQDNSTWQTALFPVTIINSNAVVNNVLTVEFTNPLTFNNSVDNYFKCGSNYITFDGNSNTCTYSNIINYNGLIENGTSSTNGYSNITVQNISASAFGNTSLAEFCGWICQPYFGKGSSNCILNNCNSSGKIGGVIGSSGNYAGGILGSYAGSQGGSATATNCYSSGAISGGYAGGIFGSYAVSATATNCYSIGAISGTDAGGIFGFNTTSATAEKCYSSGAISGIRAGGIFGSSAGLQGGLASATNCYSRGAISGGSAGGIFGPNCGSATATNCYSSGTISGSQQVGIFGPDGVSPTTQNCYVANGAWSNDTANEILLGTPTLIKNPGQIWGSNNYEGNIPYDLTPLEPTISNFSISTKTYGDASFLISPPTSNSDGQFSYTSSNPSVATISGNVITIVGVGTSIITATQEETLNYTSGTIIATFQVNQANQATPIYPICFVAGTPILTDQGSVAIEKINKKIHTINNKKIIAITQTITNEEQLVCIEKNAICLNIPSEKTIISRCHCVLYNNKMVQARYLKNMVKNKKNINNIKYNGEMLYNILMENHDTMSVNNMTVETLDPKNIIAKLYSGNYNEIQKHNLIIAINNNDCVKKNNLKKIDALSSKLRKIFMFL